MIEKFKAAVTKWINETDDAQEAWGYSEGDFNIGDFASYDNDEVLRKYLVEQDLTVEIELINDADAAY